MSRPLRSAHAAPKSRGRRICLVLITLLGLFILGTVIVLGSVRHFFGVPADAFISEDDVPWRPQDAIPRLRNPEALAEDGPPGDGGLERRAEWEEIDGLGSAVGAAAATAASEAAPTADGAEDAAEDTAEDTADDMTDDMTDDTTDDTVEDTADDTDDDVLLGPAADSPAEDDTVWGIDGKGTGGYWMRKDWDGKVQNTDSWDHLYNVSVREGEKMPRIIHQTWIDDTLPPKWRQSWRECREGMPDYVSMLWTDELSRRFIATHYPDSLALFDDYKYNIQRADAIRYFILYHFGGIYLDLDIGCRRRIEPLFQGEWEVLLPVTKPVGVSNDMLVAMPKSDFFRRVIDGLANFNNNYILNYPTVMFSTGPMMLSYQFGRYMAKNPVTPENPHAHVRVVPTSLYGKNAPVNAVPHSFFLHFYGSSWHADDAGFITWLGRWGRNLLILGSVVLVIAAVRLLWSKVAQSGGLRAYFTPRSAQYTLLPVSGSDSDRFSASGGPLSPSFELRPEIGGALRWAGNMILAAPAYLLGGSGRPQRGWLFFTPAHFQPAHGRRRTASEASQFPLREPRSRSEARAAPPPYEDAETGDSDMSEVDAFLKREEEVESDASASGSATGAANRL